MSKRVYTVVRSFTTKTGAVFQTPVRTFNDAEVAKRVAKECQDDLLLATTAELYANNATGKMERLGFGVGKLLTELGIVSFAHIIAFSDVHDTDVLIEEPKIVSH